MIEAIICSACCTSVISAEVWGRLGRSRYPCLTSSVGGKGGGTLQDLALVLGHLLVLLFLSRYAGEVYIHVSFNSTRSRDDPSEVVNYHGWGTDRYSRISLVISSSVISRYRLSSLLRITTPAQAPRDYNSGMGFQNRAIE